MSTDLTLEESSTAATTKVGKHGTAKEAVTAALLHYIRTHGYREPRIVELFGKVEFRDDWDYKAERTRNG